ncbi:MAG TPA: cell shape-determining protein [Bacteroidetes bacterium]|nr:cell shape-determining protein [Bacteroidota bacterium]
MVELAGIIILGILAQWVAWRLRVPAILPLVLIGLAVGPLSTLWTSDGEKLLEPIYRDGMERGIFPGHYLYEFVSLAIGIILFEGGLTLKKRELKTIGPTIGTLISVGALVTLVGGALAAHWVFGLNWSVSVLFSALIIVTGPTVIAPILRNVPLKRGVANVLKWEGILIDPIGATVAVLMFEFILSELTVGQYSGHAILEFVKVILVGFALGALVARTFYFIIKKQWIPHYLLNVATLALVMAVFVFSDLLSDESGLLSVVVMGTVLGNLDVPNFREVVHFKESLSILLISILFIVLAANIDMEGIYLVLHWKSLLLFGIVVLVLRPLAVFFSSRQSELTIREKLFISWIGPRGIVAAGIASLFGYKLVEKGVAGAEYITPLVFLIVVGTVLLNASTARLMARWLGVLQDDSTGILIVGANKAARLIAKYLHDNGRHVVLFDTNAQSIKKAQNMGLEAFVGNIYSDDLERNIELVDMGYLLAMTSSHPVNEFTVNRYRHILGEKGTFRLLSPEEMALPKEQLPRQGIFSYTDDFLNLNEIARDYPSIHELPINSVEELEKLRHKFSLQEERMPLFVKFADGFIDILPYDLHELPIGEGCSLVYIGKKLDKTGKAA